MPLTKTKRCSRCAQIKPVTDFHRRRHYTRSGVRAACKSCTRQQTRDARRGRPAATDPTKRRIRARTAAAIRKGDLSPLPCAVCSTLQVEAHHPRYDGPVAHLEVVWLCEKHHALEHGTHPWTDQLELFPAT